MFNHGLYPMDNIQVSMFDDGLHPMDYIQVSMSDHDLHPNIHVLPWIAYMHPYLNMDNSKLFGKYNWF